MNKLLESYSQTLAGRARKRFTVKSEEAWQDYDMLDNADLSDWITYKNRVIDAYKNYVDEIEDIYGGEEGSESRYNKEIATKILETLAGLTNGLDRFSANSIFGFARKENAGAEYGSSWYVLEHELHYITKKPEILTKVGNKIYQTDIKPNFVITQKGLDFLNGTTTPTKKSSNVIVHKKNKKPDTDDEMFQSVFDNSN